jgi:hypothetical protein
MNFLPAVISRQVASAGLKASANAPSLLFGAGIIGFIGTTVLASRATLKLDEVLSETQHDLGMANRVHNTASAEGYEGTEYSDSDFQEDKIKIYAMGIGRVARLYAPPIILGAASIYCLAKSKNLLQERNEALAAAYMAVDQAFKQYRARVIEKYGEDEDRELRYGSEQREIWDEGKGKMVEKTVVPPGTPSQYARFFDELCVTWQRNPEYNLAYLRCQQNYANDMLHSRGHVFLNEIYDRLGMERTSAGNVVGWLREGPNSDGYIDFGIWDANNLKAIDFVNGREGAILLDFNVDGPILNMLGDNND